MNVLVVADSLSQQEFQAKFKDNFPTVYKTSSEINTGDLQLSDLIFDFYSPWNHRLYAETPPKLIFVNSVMTTMAAIRQASGWINHLIGFNGLPGMFNRPLLELTHETQLPESKVEEVCKELGTEYQVVDDRVGMVTSRVLAMIINEAFFTVQEQTAVKEDIDLALQLGTRYPRGPFEFCQLLGVDNVYRLLKSLHEDTGDERYKICPLLKKHYLQQTSHR